MRKPQDDLKPFMRPPWDNMHFPSTEIPPIDKKTDDPLEDGTIQRFHRSMCGMPSAFIEIGKRKATAEEILAKEKMEQNSPSVWASNS
uniref:Uncharacterized protein n=1 Tax=Globodera pallida TaxID=36090 RepID=A0A183BR86_GLOPA